MRARSLLGSCVVSRLSSLCSLLASRSLLMSAPIAVSHYSNPSLLSTSVSGSRHTASPVGYFDTVCDQQPKIHLNPGRTSGTRTAAPYPPTGAPGSGESDGSLQPPITSLQGRFDLLLFPCTCSPLWWYLFLYSISDIHLVTCQVIQGVSVDGWVRFTLVVCSHPVPRHCPLAFTHSPSLMFLPL